MFKMENIQTGVSEIAVEQKESIKLIRNSRGYNWEIRVLDLDIERLKKIDNELQEQWGSQNE